MKRLALLWKFRRRLPVILVCLVIAYVLSPFDFIPDFIPGLGEIDDLAVLLFTAWSMFAPAFEQLRHQKSLK